MSNISEINGLNITAATASFVPASAISGTVTSASYAATASLLLGSVTSASYAATASSVNTLNQNVLITGSLTIGATSIGSNENTLVLGPSPSGGAGEGGQILLQAPGGTYTSASMIDNYQNKFRILRGTNASSDAFKMQLDMHTGQMQLPNYNSQTAFTGTPVASLSVDSSGNILTVSSSVSVIYNKIGATLAGAASPITRYHTVAGAVDTSATAVQVPLPVACTLNNFYFRTYGAQPAGGSLVVTLQKNGSDTAITVTIAAGSAAGNFTDTTNSIAFAAGDTWQLKLVQNALTGTSTGLAGYSFKSTS